MSLTIANPSLGLNTQARAVLTMLADTSLHGLSAYDKEHHDYAVETRTFAWYNGRERGVLLEVRPSLVARKCLIITFGECRCSDHIFVDSWTRKGFSLNPPTVRDYPESAYKARTTFPFGQVGQVVEFIRDKIAEFVAANTTPAQVLPELGEEEPAEIIPIKRARRQ